MLYLLLCTFNTDNRLIALLFLMNILNVLIDISWLYQGMEEFGIIALRNIVFKVISVAFIFIFIKTKEDFALYTFGLLFLNLLSSCSLWIGHRKYVDGPGNCDISPFRNLHDIIKLFIPTIAVQVYLVLDKTMLGLITKNSFENGYYAQAMNMAKMALTLVTASATVIMPRIGYFFEQGDRISIENLMNKAFRFVFFLGIPLCLGLIAISSQFVPWFYGPGFEKVAALLKVTAFLIIAIGINTVSGGVYMIATKQENRYTQTVIAGAVINVVLNAILIRKYLSVGAAAASVAAESAIMLIQLIMLRREISIMPAFRSSWKYFIAGGIMLSVLLVERRYVSENIIGSAIMVISGAAIYFFVLMLFRDAFFMESAEKVLTRIKSRVG